MDKLSGTIGNEVSGASGRPAETTKVKATNFFYVPDFDPRVFGHNYFKDPSTNQGYGLSQVIYCLANPQALRTLQEKVRFQPGA